MKKGYKHSYSKSFVEGWGGVNVVVELLKSMSGVKKKKKQKFLLNRKLKMLGLPIQDSRVSYNEVKGHGSLRLSCKDCGILYCYLRWSASKEYMCNECGKKLSNVNAMSYRGM